MIKTCIILPSGNNQKEMFWKNYLALNPGYQHDLILIHRNNMGLDGFKPINKNGELILENKIINGVDIPHQAFGAYRYYFEKYKNDYELFIFISDDVILKRELWLKYIIDKLYSNKIIGFGGSQIFNGGTKYPHESHIRAPFWFAKKDVLENIEWNFTSDHDGEMKIGYQLAKTGSVGIQVGNKLDLGFDSLEKDHITQLLEKKFFSYDDPYFIYEEFDYFKKLKDSYSYFKIYRENILSPYKHIGYQNVFTDIQPFDGLIFNPSLKVAKKELNLLKLFKDIYVLL